LVMLMSSIITFLVLNNFGNCMTCGKICRMYNIRVTFSRVSVRNIFISDEFLTIKRQKRARNSCAFSCPMSVQLPFSYFNQDWNMWTNFSTNSLIHNFIAITPKFLPSYEWTNGQTERQTSGHILATFICKCLIFFPPFLVSRRTKSYLFIYIFWNIPRHCHNY
jgi:hypothetical protein